MRKIIVCCTLLFLSGCTNQKEQKESIIIGLAGDTMLGRTLSPVIAQKGYNYPWGDTLPLLHATDYNLVNLETTLTTHTQAVHKVFNFKSDPANVQALVQARIGLVCIANNHIKDFGDDGLLETIQTLDAAGIKYAGAGKNQAAATRPIIIEKHGIKVGIIGATDNEPGWKATPEIPGTNYFSVEHPQTIIDQIKKLKSHVDVVIVSLHWGPNMRQRPTEPYIKAAHAFIDAGAHIIHGHSAHIFQGIQNYKNGLILYDTGDFVDDYAVDEQLRNDQSFFFIVKINKSGVLSMQLEPLLISNYQVNRATGDERKAILNRMIKLSDAFDTTVSQEGLWHTV